MNKNQQNHLYTLVILTYLLVLCSSCKSKKLLQETPITYKNQKELVEQFLQQPNYNFISGKAKINVSSKYGSARGTLYLRTIKDSIIWMAVKKLSVEGGRVLITQDSFYMINRLEKNYQKHALADIEERYGLKGDFSYLQSLILGMTPEIDTSNYWDLTDSKENLEIKTSVNDILHKFLVDKKSGDVLSCTFKDQFNVDGHWKYDDYNFLIDSIPVPGFRQYEIQLVNELESHSMKVNFSEIEVDNPKSIRFNIPDHYTRTY